MSEFTDEQILKAISDTLASREFEVTASLLCLLATQAPEKAALIRDAIDVGAAAS